MMRCPRTLTSLALIAILFLGMGAGNSVAAEAPRLRELRTQQVGDTVYFHVRFDPPADIYIPRIEPGPYSESRRRKLALLPQLVPQDSNAGAVYARLEIPHFRPVVQFESDSQPPLPVRGLEFVGKAKGDGNVKFLLVYATHQTAPAGKESGQPGIIPALLGRQAASTEVPVELDFSAARHIAPLRQADRARQRDDLERLWAEGQVARFAVLEALTPEFGFYGFACGATGRKYGVPAPALTDGEKANREQLHRRLYETTTGAAAITESLQLHRILNANFRDRGQRTVDIWTVPGIDIAEHPWQKMMAGQKPSPEPLAQLVPRDNYYLHFKNIRKFIEFGELLDQWGTSATRAYEMNSRDYNLHERYERQLCLKSTWLGKTLGPAVVRSLAVTGNDGYLREGSDVTVIFHVVNRPLFLAAVERFLQDARRDFGSRLKEGKADYHGVAVETFVTPLREVSLHRAVLGEFVIYSNSPTGLRRVLDTHQGRLKALADGLDFQYMRTVFRLEDKEEDGFAFLSDAFIRQLVGPASKIKEKRRLEALTSLSMVTNAALFTAWESGRLPADHKALLAASALKPEEIYTPEGRGVTWDERQDAAVSDVYNTLHFATPLVELPIDKVTPDEEREYLQFRTQYLNLWRRYFDPVGMRFSLAGDRVRVETYILPLLFSDRYSELRRFTSGGTTRFDTATISPLALAHFQMHLTPDLRALTGNGKALGDWFMLRLDDSPVLGKLAEHWVRQQFDPKGAAELDRDILRLVCQLPLTAGVRIGAQAPFDEMLTQLRGMVQAVGAKVHKLEPAYKGVTMSRIDFPPESILTGEVNKNLGPKEKPFTPVVYHAQIDGAWYVGFSADALKDLIDRSVARRDGRNHAGKGETVQINSSLYLAPGQAAKARDVLRAYLEWESHRRAVLNNPAWYALYRCGLIAENASEKTKQAAAFRYMGFVPVSPDGAAYVYDRKTDEVVNQRYGSLRRPRLHAAIEDASPLARLLDQFKTLRADLRFREDGVHTVVTIGRETPAR